MNSRIKESDLHRSGKIEEKLLGWITPKTVAITLSVTYFVSLIPLVWIGFYNYPSADDYSNGSWAHVTWMATHNVFATLWSAFQKGLSDWLHWVGYFTCGMLTALPPSAFGEKFYPAVTLIILSALTLSMIYLFKSIFVRWLHCDKYLSLSITMIALFVMVQCLMPEFRVEAFYWYSGAVNYTFIFSLGNFFYGNLIRLALEKDKKKKQRRTIGTALLGFFVGGGNQMLMLNIAVVLLFVMGVISYQKKWKDAGCFIPSFAGFYLGMLLNIVAPGNFVRAQVSQGMNPIKAILISLHYGMERCVSLWTQWPVLLCFIVIAFLAWIMTANSRFEYSSPLLVVFLSYCLTSAMMTPPLFVKANVEAGRMQAITFFVYITFAVISIVYVVGWCRKKFDGYVNRNMEDTVSFSPNFKWFLAFMAGVMIWGSGLAIIPSPHYYTFSSALTDICNGNAKLYHDTLVERTELYYSSKEKIVEVESLPVEPQLLFFSDISTDVNDWENQGVARYLGIEGVVRKPKEK